MTMMKVVARYLTLTMMKVVARYLTMTMMKVGARYLTMTMMKVEVEVVDAESKLQQVQGQADNNFIPFSADPEE